MSAHIPRSVNHSTLAHTFHREFLRLIGAVLVGLIVVLFAASQIVLGGSFDVVEEQGVRKDAQRAFDALQQDLSDLNSKAGDWGNWDDAYAFVQDPKLEFIKSNFTDDAFRQLQVNLIVYLQPSGQIVYGKAFDLERQVEIALPTGLMTNLAEPRSRDVLLRIARPEDALTGILPLPEGLVLISSRPVLTSEGKGPTRGSLIFGRYLDAAEIKELSATTHLSLTLLPLGSADLPREFRLDQPSVFVQPSSEDAISGYYLLTDIYRAPIRVLRVDEARDIYQEGQDALHYFLVWIIGISLISGVVLFRITGRLRASWQALHESDERYQIVVEHAAEGIFLVDPKTKRVLEGNAAFRALLGYSAEEVPGLLVYDILPCDRAVIDQELRHIAEGKHLSFDEGRLRRKDGSLLEIESSTSLVRNNGHPVICALVRDITGRKMERAEHDRRHRELEAERAVAVAVSQTLELNVVLDLALDQVLATLQIDSGAIYLADDAQTELALAVLRHPSPEFAKRWGRHRFGEGITGLAAALRETINIPNLDEDPRVSQENRESPRLLSQVSVPLMVQDRVVGVLNVNGYEPHHFSEGDAALLRAIAASVAVAIDHARLFETMERRVTERTAELAALNRITTVVNQSLDLDEILGTALDELTRALHARGAWVHLLDPEKNELYLRAERGTSPEIHNHLARLRVGEGLSGRAMESLQPLGVNVEASNIRTRQMMMNAGYRSLGVVPLAVGGKGVGLLVLASVEHDRFGDPELRWLAAVGNTLAVALKNARLFESVERQVNQLATLREIDRTLSSMLDLEPMLETTLRRLEEIVPYDGAAILLRDGNTLRAAAARGRDAGALKRFSLGISNNAIFREMDAKRAPIVIDELTDYPGWVVVPGLESVQSWLGAPLVAHGELIGQLSLFSAAPGAFTREHADLVLSFANHAAIAISNARLHESTRRNAERVALLNTVARTVGSTIEMDDLLETCLHLLVQVIPADSYYIGLYDPKDDTLDLRIDFDDGQRYPSSKLPAGDGLSSLVVRGRKPVLIHRLSEEMAALPVQPVITGTGRPSESWLGVPVIVGEQLVGLLAFGSYQPNAFNEEDVALLSSVASQVAIAVDNAQHHAEVEDQAQRDSLTQVFNHGYLLKRLHDEIEQAPINDSTVSLIMLDIDYFKQYNDTYGHVLGDEVLRLTAQAIQTHLKKSDIVGRWGGEEFAIVLPRANTDQARQVANRIRSTLAQMPLYDGEGKSLPKPTVSQGIAIFPLHAVVAEKLVDSADRALYRAKERGRDQIQVAEGR